MAESGTDAVAKSKTERPDLILMDVIMPGTNGYEATRTITRDEATRNIPVIICTAKDQETDRLWGFAPGRPRLRDQADRRPGPAAEDLRAHLARMRAFSQLQRLLHQFGPGRDTGPARLRP